MAESRVLRGPGFLTCAYLTYEEIYGRVLQLCKTFRRDLYSPLGSTFFKHLDLSFQDWQNERTCLKLRSTIQCAHLLERLTLSPGFITHLNYGSVLTSWSLSWYTNLRHVHVNFSLLRPWPLDPISYFTIPLCLQSLHLTGFSHSVYGVRVMSLVSPLLVHLTSLTLDDLPVHRYRFDTLTTLPIRTLRLAGCVITSLPPAFCQSTLRHLTLDDCTFQTVDTLLALNYDSLESFVFFEQQGPNWVIEWMTQPVGQCNGWRQPFLDAVASIRGSVELAMHWIGPVTGPLAGPRPGPGPLLDCSAFLCHTFEFTCFRCNTLYFIALPQNCTHLTLHNIHNERQLVELSTVLIHVESLTLAVTSYTLVEATCYVFLQELFPKAPAFIPWTWRCLKKC